MSLLRIVFFSKNNLSTISIMSHGFKLRINHSFLIRCKGKAEAIGRRTNKGNPKLISITSSMHKANKPLCHFPSTLATQLQSTHASHISISTRCRKLIQYSHIPSQNTRLKGNVFSGNKTLFKSPTVVNYREFRNFVLQTCTAFDITSLVFSYFLRSISRDSTAEGCNVQFTGTQFNSICHYDSLLIIFCLPRNSKRFDDMFLFRSCIGYCHHSSQPVKYW